MFGEVGRGLNDLAVYVLNGADVAGTKVDVPGARSLEWATESDSETIEGDDIVLATAYNAKTGSGSMGLSRMNLTAIAAMLGLTATASGVAPNQLITMEEGSAPNQASVQIKAQAMSGNFAGSAYEITIAKAKVGGVSEALEYGAWHTKSLDFTFVENAAGKFLTRKLQETRVALA